MDGVLHAKLRYGRSGVALYNFWVVACLTNSNHTYHKMQFFQSKESYAAFTSIPELTSLVIYHCKKNAGVIGIRCLILTYVSFTTALFLSSTVYALLSLAL